MPPFSLNQSTCSTARKMVANAGVLYVWFLRLLSRAMPRSMLAGHHRSDRPIARSARWRQGNKLPTRVRRRCRGTFVGRSSNSRLHSDPNAVRRLPRWRRRRQVRPTRCASGTSRRHGYTRGRLVVGQGVEIDVAGSGCGALPVSDSMISGSPRWGAAAAAVENFEENSPNTRCWLRFSMRPNVAASQNTVVPPFPRTISHPSGSCEQCGEAGAKSAHHVFHGCLSMAGSQVVPACAARALTASSRTIDGPTQNRPSTGSRSTGIRRSAATVIAETVAQEIRVESEARSAIMGAAVGGRVHPLEDW